MDLHALEIDHRKNYRPALILHGKCRQLVEKLGALIDSEKQFLRDAVPMGIYEHFKSTVGKRKFYAVDGVAEDVNGTGWRVVYRALYPPHTHLLATRDLVGSDGFLMPISRTLDDGTLYRGSRFRFYCASTYEEMPTDSREFMVGE